MVDSRPLQKGPGVSRSKIGRTLQVTDCRPFFAELRPGALPEPEVRLGVLGESIQVGGVARLRFARPAAQGETFRQD